jgi:hypothetical protein
MSEQSSGSGDSAMTCNHYSPEFVTARMREREAGREPFCPHCRLAEAEWLLRECRGDLSEWCKSYESPHDTLLLMQHVDAFLRTTDSATPRENARE